MMKFNLKRVGLFFLLIFFMSITTVKAQTGPAINHIALYVFDLKKSADFYKNVMQLKEVPEPFHDGKHVWLQIGANTYLHLIEGAKQVSQQDINSHLAFRVEDLKRFMEHLDKSKVKYRNWQGTQQATTVRTDGVMQIYLQDPDNYWIEVNNEKL